MARLSVGSAYAQNRSFRDTFTGFSGHSLLPGGFARSALAVAPRTPMAVRGSGCHLRDEAGRTVIDTHNTFAALIHGHAHPVVEEAAARAMRDGMAFGLPTMYEVDHARLTLERLRYVDQISYTTSGSEAVTLAVRLARAATGRAKIVLLEGAWHGHSDLALAPGGPDVRRGVPAGVVEDVLQVAADDVAALTEVFDTFGADIAAVLIDPRPSRSTPLSPTFWAAVRALSAAAGALLISDETVALRLAYHGAAMDAGVAPDLIVLGGLIGGGSPIGAVAGRAEWLSLLDPLQRGLPHGGTFSANPVTMAAGMACLRLFTSTEVDRLNRLGDRLRATLRPAAERLGYRVTGTGSLFGLDTGSVHGPQTALWWAAYDSGVLLAPSGQGSLSTPMTESVVDEIADHLSVAMAAVTDAVPS